MRGTEAQGGRPGVLRGVSGQRASCRARERLVAGGEPRGRRPSTESSRTRRRAAGRLHCGPAADMVFVAAWRWSVVEVVMERRSTSVAAGGAASLRRALSRLSLCALSLRSFRTSLGPAACVEMDVSVLSPTAICAARRPGTCEGNELAQGGARSSTYPHPAAPLCSPPAPATALLARAGLGAQPRGLSALTCLSQGGRCLKRVLAAPRYTAYLRCVP